MAKRPTYHIGTEDFPTKKALQEYIRAILHRYPVETHLSNSDFQFMAEVLKSHPHYDHKLGAGIKSIGIQKNSIYGHAEFFLVRVDGSRTDFSYLECLKPSNKMADFRQAARNAVSPLVIEFKRKCLSESNDLRCPYTGVVLTAENSHVDHQPSNTFEVILQRFITRCEIDVNSVSIGGHMQDNITTLWFDDPKFLKQWVTFHNRYAHLRLVSAVANMGQIKDEFNQSEYARTQFKSQKESPVAQN